MIAVWMALSCLVVSGCAIPAMEIGAEAGPKRYEATFLELFDTVTTIKGYAESEEAFSAQAQDIHDRLEEYHQLYDIYSEYEGITNLKTVNDNAGIAPVKVDKRIIDLLLLCRELYDSSGGMVNVAMGSVLELWHEAREDSVADPENAYLPDAAALEEALAHISFDTVVIDEAASTVYLADPDQRLDVGAVAKGYAAGQVAGEMPESMILSVGGNVCATGPKPDGSPWIVGVDNPDGGAYLETLAITRGAVVTSGDYQRYYTVDGEIYHHIIDPTTGWPARIWRAVTVVCADSGLADALSTALFTMDQAAGTALLERYGAQALWVSPDGEVTWSEGFSAYLQSSTEK